MNPTLVHTRLSDSCGFDDPAVCQSWIDKIPLRRIGGTLFR